MQNQVSARRMQLSGVITTPQYERVFDYATSSRVRDILRCFPVEAPSC